MQQIAYAAAAAVWLSEHMLTDAEPVDRLVSDLAVLLFICVQMYANSNLIGYNSTFFETV